MNDFSLKIGKAGKGVVAAVLAAVKYVVVPMLILTALTTAFAQMEGASTITGQLDLENIKQYVLLLGVPITLLAFFRGFYPKGTRSRFVFGEAVTVLACIWIWMIMMGGNLVLEFEEFGFSISYLGFVLLFILAAALGGVYYLAEMLSYRNEWLRSREPQLARPTEGAA